MWGRQVAGHAQAGARDLAAALVAARRAREVGGGREARLQRHRAPAHTTGAPRALWKHAVQRPVRARALCWQWPVASIVVIRRRSDICVSALGMSRRVWAALQAADSNNLLRVFSAAQGHIRGLAAVTANTRAHGAPFRHMLFYGPPGARCSATCCRAQKQVAAAHCRACACRASQRCMPQESYARLVCRVASLSWCCAVLHVACTMRIRRIL